ncbi:hypothetical protein GE061_012882 [Apolygus lucorum]|uniref:Peptidase M13 N-terminal domain-containing protein n=1 Tax=Apolygus lucorum TaxID=248454 RepID=A0A6A4JK26_APOLU|nr:hypothetical protein GE061_012882 [Apolygus lucorum]
MEQSNGSAQFPRTASNDNSVWTVEGSQHQLAPTISKSENISLFSKLSRKRLESYLTASLFTLLLLLVALLITIYLVTSTSVIFSKVCYSPDCIRSAANLLESMNATAKPCDNFFKYACGRWRTNHAGPEPYWTNSWFIDRAAIQKRDVIEFLSRENSDDDPGGVKDARKVYKACINLESQEETGVEYLWSLLDQIGLPRNPFNKTFTPNPWVETLARTRRYLAMNLFIGASVMPSIANSTLNQLTLSTPDTDDALPGWNWERRKFYSELKKKMSEDEEDEDGNDATAVSWVKYGSRLISYLVEETGDQVEESDFLIASDTILQIIRNISAIQESENVTGSLLNEVPVEMNLADVQTLIDEASASGDSKLNLESYFDVLFSEFSELEVNFTQDKLLVYKKPYYPLIAEYLESLEDSDINLYIWWNVVYTLASHTNEDLKLVKENFVRKIIGDFPVETRSSVCMQTVYTLMSPALGFFLTQRIEQTRINKVHSMIGDIRQAFISYIRKLTWMDGKTKSASIDKLNNFNVFVGFPEWMKNRTEFDGLFVNVTLAEDEHFHNVANLLDATMVSFLESLRTTNDHST